MIEHRLPNGQYFTSIYGHLATLGVHECGAVNRGDLIGTVGTTSENGGWGEHLHFGIHQGAYSGQPSLNGYLEPSKFPDNWCQPWRFINSRDCVSIVRRFVLRDFYSSPSTYSIYDIFTESKLVVNNLNGLDNQSVMTSADGRWLLFWRLENFVVKNYLLDRGASNDDVRLLISNIPYAVSVGFSADGRFISMREPFYDGLRQIQRAEPAGATVPASLVFSAPVGPQFEVPVQLADGATSMAFGSFFAPTEFARYYDRKRGEISFEGLTQGGAYFTIVIGISADGKFVLLRRVYSQPVNPINTIALYDIQRQTQVALPGISPSEGWAAEALSPDGNCIVFRNLAVPTTHFIYDRTKKTTSPLSVPSDAEVIGMHYWPYDGKTGSCSA